MRKKKNLFLYNNAPRAAGRSFTPEGRKSGTSTAPRTFKSRIHFNAAAARIKKKEGTPAAYRARVSV